METSKTTTRTTAVITKPYTYEFYGERTAQRGDEYPLGSGHYRLDPAGGLVITLGHGIVEVIPPSHFKLVAEVVTTPAIETHRL